jgi:hypothetical protein
MALVFRDDRRPRPPHRPGYRVHEYEEDASWCTPGAYWRGGSDCYYVRVRCYVPCALRDENLPDWIENHADDEPSIWID